MKARDNKSRFRLYETITVIASAIIPIINVANFEDFQTRTISSIIGGIISVVTGITQLEKYQENWILFRTSSDLLKKESTFLRTMLAIIPISTMLKRINYWLRE